MLRAAQLTMPVLETSVLYDYFPNFIAQLCSALHRAARKWLIKTQL
jgi:hypothetical protein